MGETLKLTPTESVANRSSTAGALAVEATNGTGSKRPPKHFHPSQDEERFEVLSGSIPVRVEGRQRPLAFGVLLSEYRDAFRLAGPDLLLRLALALLGRAPGYSA